MQQCKQRFENEAVHSCGIKHFFQIMLHKYVFGRKLVIFKGRPWRWKAMRMCGGMSEDMGVGRLLYLQADFLCRLERTSEASGIQIF